MDACDVKVLAREAVPGYIDDLTAALGHLRLALESRLKATTVGAYVERIRNTLSCVRYVFLWPDRFTVESSFTIDPTDSGLPHFNDFWRIQKDREQAAPRLEELASPDEIVSRALAEILAGQYPLVWQRALVERRYYERVGTAEVVADFELSPPSLLEGNAGRPVLRRQWSGLAENDTLFLHYMMLYSLERGHILCCTFEEIVCDSRFDAGQFWEPLGDTLTPAANDAGERTVRLIVCPPEVKARLGGTGLDGSPARVFGVAESGEIYE
ncbi:MAG: hypothetical protein HY815_14780 [Candidatus Riflebacteria bacterium]|nr:hypothetical protein [Candidatus Riflebacteria bacterium]